MKNKFKKGLIIGPSGIGKVHIRQFLKNGISDLALLGKKKNKKRFAKLNLLNIKKKNITILTKFSEIKKFSPQIISICSPFYLHFKHILKCKNYSKYLIVEKPFIWLEKKSGDEIQKKAFKLLNDKKLKLLVNLPMLSIVNQLQTKKEIPKKIQLFSMYYFTKGMHSYNEIVIDLLPHAISFVLSLSKKLLKSYKIISVKKKRFESIIKIEINDIYCVFHFKQNKKKKQSSLTFKINDILYERKQNMSNGEFIESLVKNKKKLIRLKNPMSHQLNTLIDSFGNNMYIRFNNNLVKNITKLTNNILNFKN
jgi:hypothetical protein